MALHFKAIVDAALSSSSNEERDKANISKELVLASAREGGNWHRIVLASTTDLQLELPGIADAKALLILTSLHIPEPAPSPAEVPVYLEFKLNDTVNTPIKVTPMDDGIGVLLLSTDALSALYVSNPDPVVGMEVAWLAVGD